MTAHCSFSRSKSHQEAKRRFYLKARRNLIGSISEESERSHVSPIVVAAAKAAETGLSQLVEHFYHDRNCSLANKHEAIRNAAEKGDLTIFTCLTTLLKTEDPKMKDLTVLHFAAMYGNERLINAILSENPELTKIQKTNALFLAIEHSNYSTIQAFIHAGIDPAAVDAKGNTALHLAIQKGDLETLQILVGSNLFDINGRNKGGLTPIMYAIILKKTEFVRYLVNVNGINPEAVDGFENKTALHLAAQEGALEIVKILVEKFQFLINREDISRQTPFMVAIDYAKTACVKYLVDFIDPTPGDEAVYDDDGETFLHGDDEETPLHNVRENPLHMAAIRSNNEILQILVDSNRFDVNKKDINGSTALMCAIKANLPNNVRCLLKAPGTKLDLIDWEGNNVFEKMANEASTEIGVLIRAALPHAPLEDHGTEKLIADRQSVHSKSVDVTVPITLTKLNNQYSLKSHKDKIDDDLIPGILDEIRTYLTTEIFIEADQTADAQAKILDIQLEAIACFERLIPIIDIEEAKTHFNLKKVLCLAWKGINDRNSNPEEFEYTDEDMKERRRTFATALFNIQNEYVPRDKNGELARGADGRPLRTKLEINGKEIQTPKIACIGGTFNDLVLILDGTNKFTRTVIFNRALLYDRVKESVARELGKKSSVDQALIRASEVEPSLKRARFDSKPKFETFAEECREIIKTELLAQGITFRDDGLYVEDENIMPLDVYQLYLSDEAIERALEAISETPSK